MARVLAALGWFALVGCASAQDDLPRCAPSAKLPGGEVYEWTSAEGAPYRYRLPKSLASKAPPNLVLMLHGTGLRYYWAFANYPIAAGRFRGDDIVVAPEGLTPGSGDTFNFVQGKQDGEHIAGLIREFRAEFPIGRVYLYGHSQGAFFCYWFAGEFPDLVDGIVAHAGNVLQVEHSKQSREGVAIGILHGKADAVVPVDCAYRTEKIYREQGYKNVKLYVVEGLTEQSGHWPLPVQAAEMFDWLDEVTEVSAERALARALDELRADEPDLAAIAGSFARATELAKRDKAAKSAGFRADRELVQQALAAIRDAHVAACSGIEALAARKPEYGPWCARFRSLDRVFGDDPAWAKALPAPTRTARSHAKQCERALAALGEPSAKSLRTAHKALAGAVLAPSYDALRGMLESVLDEPPAGTKPDVVGELRSLIEGRRAVDEQGAAEARRTTTDAVKVFRDADPRLEETDGSEK